MKVVCITLQDFTNGSSIRSLDGIMEVGDVFTVVRECYGYTKHNQPIPSYELAEMKTGLVYDKRNFSPCSGIDETTLVNEEWEQKVCVPVNEKSCV